MMKTVKDIPTGGFIPEHLSRWAVISVYLPDVPAVELELDQDGGLSGKVTIKQSVDIKTTENDKDRYLPSALFVKQENNEIVCVFDIEKHGWDAVQCDFTPEYNTESIEVSCINCGADTFEIRIPWLGYQVFDEGPPDQSGSLKYRNSFDSISIDMKCCSCGTSENILNEETA